MRNAHEKLIYTKQTQPAGNSKNPTSVESHLTLYKRTLTEADPKKKLKKKKRKRNWIDSVLLKKKRNGRIRI